MRDRDPHKRGGEMTRPGGNTLHSWFSVSSFPENSRCFLIRVEARPPSLLFNGPDHSFVLFDNRLGRSGNSLDPAEPSHRPHPICEDGLQWPVLPLRRCARKAPPISFDVLRPLSAVFPGHGSSDGNGPFAYGRSDSCIYGAGACFP